MRHELRVQIKYLTHRLRTAYGEEYVVCEARREALRVMLWMLR